MDDNLIRTFAQTFGFPYTQTPQDLPPLQSGRHLHLGALAGFYRHMDGTWQSDNPSADYWLEMETLFLQWLTYARLPDIWQDWAFGWDDKAKQYLPIEGWREEWAVFVIMFDDSILFADTAAPGSPVYWLMTGCGTVENRRPVAPSVAVLMQTLSAVYDFEQEWRAAGRAFYDEDGCCKTAELRAALHGLLYRELPPECAAGFEEAFWG
ncbi:MAG: hypothetical protein Q3966_07740 [Neisseria sp.]|nr:hypothetical protein [Neisseria sp.]